MLYLSLHVMVLLLNLYSISSVLFLFLVYEMRKWSSVFSLFVCSLNTDYLPWKARFICTYLHVCKQWMCFLGFFFLWFVFYSLSLVSRFYRKMCLSIIPCSSATRSKNTLPTPAVFHPAYPHVIKHVCWDTLSLSQTHCTDDISSPDPSSSWRKTSRSAVSCHWHPECRKIKLTSGQLPP